jgi:hypothetical protein
MKAEAFALGANAAIMTVPSGMARKLLGRLTCPQ